MSTSGGGSLAQLWDTINNGEVTVPRSSINETVSAFPVPVSGDLLICYFRAQNTGQRSNLGYQLGGSAGNALTLAKLAIYTQNADLSLDVIAQTANLVPLPAAFATGNANTVASFTLTAGRIYGAAALTVGTGPASWEGCQFVDAFGGAVPNLANNVHAQADIPAHVAPGSLVVTNVGVYMRIT